MVVADLGSFVFKLADVADSFCGGYVLGILPLNGENGTLSLNGGCSPLQGCYSFIFSYSI